MKPVARLAGVSVGGKNPTRLLGVLNISPESFFGGSVHTRAAELARAAERMQRDGADILDVGAMSTAPYLSTQITEDEEIRRLEWAIRIVRRHASVPLSVDSPRSRPASAALAAGADILNDVTGLAGDPGMARVATSARGAILMAHPVGLGRAPTDPMKDTLRLLRAALDAARRAGVADGNVVLDPGIGFFRGRVPWWKWDLQVLRGLPAIAELPAPVLVGVSRKSFIGHLSGGLKAPDRLPGSLAAAAWAVARGAAMIRTHDVAETRQAVRVAEAIVSAGGEKRGVSRSK